MSIIFNERSNQEIQTSMLNIQARVYVGNQTRTPIANSGSLNTVICKLTYYNNI